jgi:hypothetical protein
MIIIAGYPLTGAADWDAAVGPTGHRSMRGARSPILRGSGFVKSTSVSFEPSGAKSRSESQQRQAARLRKA